MAMLSPRERTAFCIAPATAPVAAALHPPRVITVVDRHAHGVLRSFRFWHAAVLLSSSTRLFADRTLAGGSGDRRFAGRVAPGDPAAACLVRAEFPGQSWFGRDAHRHRFSVGNWAWRHCGPGAVGAASRSHTSSAARGLTSRSTGRPGKRLFLSPCGGAPVDSTVRPLATPCDCGRFTPSISMRRASSRFGARRYSPGKCSVDRTEGYRHHPQLQRFRSCELPRSAINRYLAIVWTEAQSRGYRFDRSKLGRNVSVRRIRVTDGQLQYEWRWLLNKLQRRNPIVYRRHLEVSVPTAHPLFRVVSGPVAEWEHVQQ